MRPLFSLVETYVKKIPINDLLRQTLTEYIAENEQEFVFMSHKSKKSLVFKAFFLKMLIDKVDKESFIQMLFSYNNQSDDGRETISMCIEVFLTSVFMKWATSTY